MSRCAPVSRWSLLALVAFAMFLHGCLSYDESGTLEADGSGDVQIGFGLAGEPADPQKIGEVRYALKHQPGLHWIANFDSFGRGRHWYVSEIHFDSLAALRRLNSILPLESLFGNSKLITTDSGMVWRRSVRLPAGTTDSPDKMQISWRVPGTILATDRRGKWEPGSKLVTWNLPTTGQAGEWAVLEVRWEPSLLQLPTLRWSSLAPTTPRQTWSLAMAVATLLAAILLAVVTRRRLQLARQTPPEPFPRQASSVRA